MRRRKSEVYPKIVRQWLCLVVLLLSQVACFAEDHGVKLDAATLELVRKIAPLAITNERLDLDLAALNARGEDEVRGGTKVLSKSTSVDADARINVDSTEFSLSLEEKDPPHRKVFMVRSIRDGFAVNIEDTATQSAVRFAEPNSGEISLTISNGGQSTVIKAATFVAMIQQEPVKVQLALLHPLADWGIDLALHPSLPVVIAAAVSGFCDPAPAVAGKVDALIQQLRDGNTDATGPLTKIYPMAIARIKYAAEWEKDPKVRDALAKVIASHPGIARAIPYVLQNRLHEDKKYLESLTKIPLFREAAESVLRTLKSIPKYYDEEGW